MNSIIVKELLEEREYQLELEIISGEDALDKAVTDSTIHKLGLALTGINFSLDPGQVQLMGGAEIAYLQMLGEAERLSVIDRLAEFDFPCMIITRGLHPPEEMIQRLKAGGISCLGSGLDTGEFIKRLDRFLDDRLAPRISFHGVLIDVIGIGVLILGQSGIGKSETALDLVLKGHRLVADDIVEIFRRGNSTLMGKASEMIQFHMEIRGLGIINIQELLGISATRARKKIDVVIEMVEWEEGKDYDRLGLEEDTYPILGIEIPHLTIPVRPGRNLSSIIEVAARNQLLKQRGHHSAREFQSRLLQGLTVTPDNSLPTMYEVE